ncbi:hypothetical protein FPZ12_017940 [Amycolatopsis acidicola]|uniref:Uncharacterized protein n=2 Tax=Amycolatopsis acidicola TaxID=2596893 RepID=A0A5N0V2N7_9PSEU|nr:hypothetical protein FPZ12_017940 [Amycolatopsis acidicola]
MSWSSAERAVLTRAVGEAPSVHNLVPWTAEIRAAGADLYDHAGARRRRHDPAGRDRVISGGAALTNLELALRALGWAPETVLLPDAGRLDLLARVTSPHRHEATPEEVRHYSAIYRRHSYRSPFAVRAIDEQERRRLAAVSDGAMGRILDPAAESAPLAEFLSHAGQAPRDDVAYRRELRAWSSPFGEPHGNSALPWAHLPDTATLAKRLAAEALVLVLTPDDTRRDHLLAGHVMEQIWLAAVARGLAGSVLTRPLRLHQVRAGLAAELGLAGFPQLILRFGYPVTGPRS